jgi:hypothetical protein
VKLTNGQVANLIEALTVAIDNNKCFIDSNIPPKSVPREAWSKEDKETFAEWTAEMRRWRKLRKLLLGHERAA